MSQITLVLQAYGRGDVGSEEVLPLVYDDLKRHAVAQMSHEPAGHTLQPTALLHEAWLRLTGGGEKRWQNRAHFFGAAAEAMRRILIDAARRKARIKRGGDQVRVDIDKVELADASPDEKILLLDEALEKLRSVDAEKAQVVMLKFYGNRTNKEVADTLGVTERTVERQWAYAKAWLFQCIRKQN